MLANEERMIADTAIEFQSNGTPLDRNSPLDLARTYVDLLPIDRQKSIGFRANRPGRNSLSGFLKRFPELCVKSTVSLEHAQAEAMCPANVAARFEHVKSAL